MDFSPAEIRRLASMLWQYYPPSLLEQEQGSVKGGGSRLKRHFPAVPIKVMLIDADQ